jgi:hypothetical protein
MTELKVKIDVEIEGIIFILFEKILMYGNNYNIYTYKLNN